MARKAVASPQQSPKEVYWIEDFSGGLNMEGSGLKENTNQGTFYRNAEFTNTGWFTKRGGFQGVLLCEGKQPSSIYRGTGSLVFSVIKLHNPLETYNNDDFEHSVFGKVKVRPFEYIVGVARSIATYRNQFHILKYNPATKTYDRAQYYPIKYNDGSQKHGVSIDATYTAPNGSETKRTFKYEKDFNWAKLSQSTVLEDIIIEADIQRNVLLKDPLYISIKEWELGGKYGPKPTTNQVIRGAYNQEEFIELAKRVTFFTNGDNLYLKIGGKGPQNLLLKKGLDDDHFKQVLPESTTTKEEEILGWNLSLAFYKYLKKSDHAAFITFAGINQDFSSLNTIANILNSDFSFQTNYDGVDDTGTFRGLRSNYRGIQPGGKIFNSYLPKKADPTQDIYMIWADSRVNSECKVIASSKQGWNAAKGEIEHNVSSIVNKRPTDWTSFSADLVAWKSGLDRQYGHNSRITTNTYRSVFSYTDNVVAKGNTASFEVLLALDYYASYSVVNDKELFKANYVSLTNDDEANTNINDINNLMATSKVYTFNNFVANLTPKRVFFSVPLKPNFIPHNWDYKVPLLDEKDELQATSIMFERLILFSKYQTFSFKGNSPSIHAKNNRLVLKDLNPSVGAFAANSIQRAVSSIIFMSQKGIKQLVTTYAANDELNTKNIDDAISPLTRDFREMDEHAKSCYFDGVYYLYVPSKDAIYFCNIRDKVGNKGSWGEWTSPLFGFDNNTYLPNALLVDKEKHLKSKYPYAYKNVILDFYPNNNTNELMFLSGLGILYVKTKDQHFDGFGNFQAGDRLGPRDIDVLYETTELTANLPLHKKKFKNIIIQAYVPGKRGAELFVGAKVDGFLATPPPKTPPKTDFLHSPTYDRTIEALYSSKHLWKWNRKSKGYFADNEVPNNWNGHLWDENTIPGDGIRGILTPTLSYDAGSWLDVMGSFDTSRLGYNENPKQLLGLTRSKGDRIKIRIRNVSKKQFALKAVGFTYKLKNSK